MYTFTELDSTPELKDLIEYITPSYAPEWKEIGIKLDMPIGVLNFIAAENRTIKRCCNEMLEKWLDLDTTASWRKLINVIESEAVSGSCIGDFNF